MIKISRLIRIIFLSVVLSLILTLTTDYGIITHLIMYSKPYSSDDQLLKSFNLEFLSAPEKAWQIYSHVKSKIEHKFTYYSFFENPTSVIFETIVFEPLYKIIADKKSQFLNTLREPYLLFNAGGGICHQSAIAIVKLAEKAGLEGRVIWLGGHVVSELYYDNSWHLFDANMGITFQEDGHVLSYNEIINQPNLIYNTFKKKGWKEEQIKQIANMYLTTDNNYFYHLHPHEAYIKIYYFLTRLFSYILYILIFLSTAFSLVKKVK